ncbi:hypothetical protein TNCV_3369631 [Trichonephila clavipes]|uniref:Uncharacterized protein n=1 Tax=Trichonephila clavipes TaxID=2585209 RepID=A0A8X6R782_TRICX|nr:hypothetical protein TNCV_3369631 [Trichonephila clavipes]
MSVLFKILRELILQHVNEHSRSKNILLEVDCPNGQTTVKTICVVYWSDVTLQFFCALGTCLIGKAAPILSNISCNYVPRHASVIQLQTMVLFLEINTGSQLADIIEHTSIVQML